MTTTQADLPSTLTAKPPARAAASKASGRHGLSRWWLMTPLFIVLASLGAWQTYERITRPPLGADIRLYEIKRMSFPVVLEEKGELQPIRSVDIRNEMESGTRDASTIIEIVPEGTQVKEGDLLVQLASDTIENQILTQQIEVTTARSELTAAENDLAIQKNLNAANIDAATTLVKIAKIELEEWREGLRRQKIEEAKGALETATSRAKQAKAQLERSLKGFEERIVQSVEVEQDRISAIDEELKRKNAEISLEVLEDYTFEKERLTYQAAVEDAMAALVRAEQTAASELQKAGAALVKATQSLELKERELSKYKQQLENSKIFAPQPGLVVYHNERSRGNQQSAIDVGAKVFQNQVILKLPDLSEMELVVRIHEADAEKIKPGLPARIEVSGIYEETEGESDGAARATGKPKMFEGEVSRIAALADSRNRWLNPDLREFETKIKLLGSDPRLKPGMTATVEIFVDHVDNVLAVPVQAVYSRGGAAYVFVEANSGAQVREVTLGGSSAKYVEVVDGVVEGDRVWMNISDEMLTLLPTQSREDIVGEVQADDAEAPRRERPNRAGRGAGPADGGGGAPAAQRGGEREGGGGRGNMFERLDANKDGKITKDEFTGPEQFFTRMDTNGDGEITAAEAAAARAAMGGGGRGGSGGGGGS